MDTGKYIEIFCLEAEEHMQVLRQGVVALEKGGGSPERLRELLRSAHTLKGSARLLNLDDLNRLSHRMEDLFKDLEGGQRQVTPELVDLLLLAIEGVSELVQAARSGEAAATDIDALVAGFDTGILPAAKTPETGQKKGSGKAAAETVRTSVSRLDTLVNLIGEVQIARGMLDGHVTGMDRLRQRLDLFMGRLQTAEDYRQLKEIRDLMGHLSTALERDIFTIEQLSGALQGEAMGLRMQPLATITDDFETLLRGMAREQGKEVSFTVTGKDVELDRQMLEEVKPMLVHLLRNAVDHGLEPPAVRHQAGKKEAGRIELQARYEGDAVQLTLSDDGRGIDPAQVRQTAVARRMIDAERAASLSDEEAVYLVLEPGFTTLKVATDFSGRGVGMDVVKTGLDRIKGNLVIHSTPGRGTRMVLKIPLTLAVTKGLIVQCEQETFVVPLHYVAEMLSLGEQDILYEGGLEVVRVGGATLPLVSLREILGVPQRHSIRVGERMMALVLSFREQSIACLVSRSVGVQELVVKGMGKQLKRVRFFSGASILGDGHPALILSVPDLFSAAAGGPSSHLRRELEAARQELMKGRILVVDDSVTTRTMEKNILETRGYQVETAISGEDALEKLSGDPFDLVVSDVEMPGINGFELTSRIRQMEHTKEVPVIIVTSFSSDEDKRRGLEVGAQAYIVKGNFDQGTLLDAVETFVG